LIQTQYTKHSPNDLHPGLLSLGLSSDELLLATVGADKQLILYTIQNSSINTDIKNQQQLQ